MCVCVCIYLCVCVCVCVCVYIYIYMAYSSYVYEIPFDLPHQFLLLTAVVSEFVLSGKTMYMENSIEELADNLMGIST